MDLLAVLPRYICDVLISAVSLLEELNSVSVVFISRLWFQIHLLSCSVSRLESAESEPNG